jgi:hypothetical protein
LIIQAERDGKLIAFAFAVPDYAGKNNESVVLKTLARSPERQFAGLGRLLTDCIHQRADEMGFKTVIHALMASDNHSCNISSRTARVFRKYALFSREL